MRAASGSSGCAATRPAGRSRSRRRGDRAARIARNASALGVPELRVVRGGAPAALAGLPGPDAVFVGGGVTADGLVEACWERCAAGGRLVANAVTMESEAVLAPLATASSAAT